MIPLMYGSWLTSFWSGLGPVKTLHGWPWITLRIQALVLMAEI